MDSADFFIKRIHTLFVVLVTNNNYFILVYMLLKQAHIFSKRKYPEPQGRARNVIYMNEEMYLSQLSEMQTIFAKGKVNPNHL